MDVSGQDGPKYCMLHCGQMALVNAHGIMFLTTELRCHCYLGYLLNLDRDEVGPELR